MTKQVGIQCRYSGQKYSWYSWWHRTDCTRFNHATQDGIQFKICELFMSEFSLSGPWHTESNSKENENTDKGRLLFIY